jgi:hypothetical protein
VDLSAVKSILSYFTVLPVLGLLFSVIAFFVIRREYHLYNAVEARLLYIERELGLASRPDFHDLRLKHASKESFSVEGYMQEVRPIGTFIPWKARIRALFLGGFIVFALMAVVEIAYCLFVLL